MDSEIEEFHISNFSDLEKSDSVPSMWGVVLEIRYDKLFAITEFILCEEGKKHKISVSF